MIAPCGSRLAVCMVAALWAIAALAGESSWPDHLTIGTASRGGTYYVYGEGLAKILTSALGLPVAALPTDGPAQNIELLESGEAKIGFVTTGIALQALNGTGIWAGHKPARSMRVIFPMYDTPFQFLVLQNSNIRSVAEMGERRIGIGPRGGTAGAYVPKFFKVLNLSAHFTYGEWTDLAAQFENKELDVLAVGAGVPFPSFVELERKNKVRYVPLADDQIATLRLVMPELTRSRIPAGTYASLNRHYQTIGLYNFAVAHEDLPDYLVYQIVKTVFEKREQMTEVHAAAAATVPANIERNSFVPLHPGAIRYYRMIGKAGETD